MRVFVATAYSSQVDYSTGKVSLAYHEFLEQQFRVIEEAGGEVFSAIRHDNYKINESDPAGAFWVDLDEIKKCDLFMAFLSEKVSAGVQTEIGMAVALDKEIILARPSGVEIGYFNNAMVRSGLAQEIDLPLDNSTTAQILR